MSEELLGVLNGADKERLQETIEALEYFKKEPEFVYPLDNRDRWAFEKLNGKQEAEAKKVEMEVLHRARLVRREEVPGIVPYAGNIMVYELNGKGKEIFEKLFDETPKMCDGRHYATPG